MNTRTTVSETTFCRQHAVAKRSAAGGTNTGMAKITRAEQKRLEELLGMGDGYAHAVFSSDRDVARTIRSATHALLDRSIDNASQGGDSR